MRAVNGSFGLAMAFASTGLSLLAMMASSAAGAQPCQLQELKQGDRTELAQANFSCLLSRVERLEEELAPFREAKGAVIAFDRSESVSGDAAAGACPTGWTLFRPAGGRTLVGAGQHQNVDMYGQLLRSYPAYLDNHDNSVGGAETHSLKREELPDHEHNIGEYIGGGTDQRVGEGPFTYVFPHGSITDRAVGNFSSGKTNFAQKAHNNMPPYIALYFCKKE